MHQPHVVSPTTTVTVALGWSAVPDPNGDPVQYRVQVDDSPVFAIPDVDSGWIDATSFSAALSATVPGVRHHVRVMARDAANDRWSPWSTTDWFIAYMQDPY